MSKLEGWKIGARHRRGGKVSGRESSRTVNDRRPVFESGSCLIPLSCWSGSFWAPTVNVLFSRPHSLNPLIRVDFGTEKWKATACCELDPGGAVMLICVFGSGNKGARGGRKVKRWRAEIIDSTVRWYCTRLLGDLPVRTLHLKLYYLEREEKPINILRRFLQGQQQRNVWISGSKAKTLHLKRSHIIFSFRLLASISDSREAASRRYSAAYLAFCLQLCWTFHLFVTSQRVDFPELRV